MGRYVFNSKTEWAEVLKALCDPNRLLQQDGKYLKEVDVKIITLMVLILSFIGCAALSHTWKHPQHYDDLRMEDDIAACRDEANQAADKVFKEQSMKAEIMGEQIVAEENQTFTKCMTEKGWYQVESDKSTNIIAPANKDIPEGKRRLKSKQPPVDTVKTGSQLGFDECFQKCTELTDRSKEQCFDTCLSH